MGMDDKGVKGWKLGIYVFLGEKKLFFIRSGNFLANFS